ncbi:MAG: hypothetical protein GF398_15065 [Chitinivibrionales bacterium]|nr:hypothetical protein [Chitinivibrionales bacterium]
MLILLILPVPAHDQESLDSAENSFGIGLSSGYVAAGGDFGIYWHNSAHAGLSFRYPFHAHIPAFLTVSLSNHKPIDDPLPRPGYAAARSSVLLASSAVSWQYEPFLQKAISPFAGGGINTHTWILYKSWPPDYNSDETEFGIHGAAGMRAYLARWCFGLEYRHYASFTRPHVIHDGSVLFTCEYLFELKGLNHGD